MTRTRRAAPELALLALYVAVVIALALRHELWRDEVRTLNLAAAHANLFALLGDLRNEGHPALWNIVVWAGFRLGGYLAMKPLAAAIGAAVAALVLWRAPFVRWQRALLVLGVFPVYEWGVMCRDYGLAALCLFAACCAWPGRWRRPWLLALCLALAMNTHAHSFLLAGALALAWGLDAWRARAWTHPERARLRLWLLSGALLAGAALAAVLVARPDASTIVLRHGDASVADWWRALAHFARTPIAVFPELVGGISPDTRMLAPAPTLALLVAGSLGVWAAVAWLAARAWPLAVGLVVGLASVSCFADLVYIGVTRHHSLAFAFLVALLWLAQLPEEGPRPPARPWRRWATQGVVALVLVGQVVALAVVARDEWRHARTAAPALGALLAARGLGEAVVVGEPDHVLETLPYYAPRARIYLAREARFYPGKVSFTTANRAELSLAELLDDAERLAKAAPVVLVLSARLDERGPFAIPYGFGKIFRYDLDSLARLRRLTPLGELYDAQDETYAVWRVDR